MKLIIDESHAGSGKTSRQFDLILREECKVLFIVEKIDRIKEFRDEIERRLETECCTPKLDEISSRECDRRESVASQIKALPSKYADAPHVIVFATHAAMLNSDFTDFDGWQIIVDEVPSFLDFEQKRTHLDQAFFNKYYHLAPFEGEWNKVTLTDEGRLLSAAAVRDDDSHRHLAKFHQRVLEASRPGAERIVLCNLAAWKAMIDAKVQWCWASVFSLQELKAFSKVTLLGNRFRADIGINLAQSFDDKQIEWVELPSLKGSRAFHSRNVYIHYFSENREATSNLFGSAGGKKMLTEIGSYLARELGPCKFIWTANDANGQQGGLEVMTPKQALERGGLKNTEYREPRQAGTNAYQDINHAVAIYAAKPAPNLIALLKARTIPVEQWAQSIEHETIVQFMTRTSVRNADSATPVQLWVFDRVQALFLKNYFDGLDYVTATMALVEDGPVIPEKDKVGPKITTRTPEEQLEYLAMKLAKDKERKRRKRAEAKALKSAA